MNTPVLASVGVPGNTGTALPALPVCCIDKAQDEKSGLYSNDLWLRAQPMKKGRKRQTPTRPFRPHEPTASSAAAPLLVLNLDFPVPTTLHTQ